MNNKARRLARLPVAVQWAAAIDLAIAFANCRAASSEQTITLTRERYWYWPDCAMNVADDSGWWLIPLRVDSRSRALFNRAIETKCNANGTASAADIVALLKKWKTSGKWEKLCAKMVSARKYTAYD